MFTKLATRTIAWLGLDCNEDNRDLFAVCPEHADCQATICLDCDTVLDCDNS